MSNIETNTSHTLANIGEETKRPASLAFDPARYRAEVDRFLKMPARAVEIVLLEQSLAKVSLGARVSGIKLDRF